MHGLHICVAGVERESRRHLRPVTDLGEERMGRELLAVEGGPFELGAVVELGPVQPRPISPAVEDCRFQPRRARRIRRLAPRRYLELIDDISQRSLRNAFGPELRRRGTYKYATDLGKGERSLAVVRLRGPLALEIDDFDRLQLCFEAAGRAARAPVNDLRFYEDDQVAFRHDVIDDVSKRLRRGVPAWAMFGLGRAWKASSDDVERHWLQVNGLCLEDLPLGQRP